MEYSSNGKGNLGVTLGAIGTGLGVLNNGIGLLGNVQGMIPSNNTPTYATKDEMKMMQEISYKDSEIALLKADQASEVKMTEVYKQAHSEVAALRKDTESALKDLQSEINQNRRDQDAWNASQSVINAQMSAAITTNTNSIAALQDCCSQITQLKIPNSAVCPGWGPITVTPTPAGTTIA